MDAETRSRPDIGFAGGTLDRADRLREDPAALAAVFADPAARQILLDGLDPVADGAALVTAPLPAEAEIADFALLGLGEDAPLFVALPEGPPKATGAPGSVWQTAAVLGPEALAHFGAARSLVSWHGRHRFCANCGAMTSPVRAGWSRRCGGCGTEHYPRVDPVVIMLAEYRGKILIGRQPMFPPGRYSALAGFVEVGETIEEAVARELFEEAGVRAVYVRYAMSQPWPFPSSLMMACIAEVEDDRITLDERELEHAMWVDRDQVAASMRGEPDAVFIAPPRLAIANSLFRLWLGEQGVVV